MKAFILSGGGSHFAIRTKTGQIDICKEQQFLFSLPQSNGSTSCTGYFPSGASLYISKGGSLGHSRAIVNFRFWTPVPNSQNMKINFLEVISVYYSLPLSLLPSKTQRDRWTKTCGSTLLCNAPRYPRLQCLILRFTDFTRLYLW
jgi:hypothetical protein